MKILIGIGHPKHVHFWRNILIELGKRGHETKLVIRDKDVISTLLNYYKIDYELLGKNHKGLIKKGSGLLDSIVKLIIISIKFKPDLYMGGADLGPTSRIFRKPNIFIHDTEHSTIENYIIYFFSDVICTPAFFK